MLTANWDPCWMGKPMARTSIALSSRDCTEMFMSRSFTSPRTVAPASSRQCRERSHLQTTCARCSVMSHSVERGTALTLSISDVKRRRNLSKISVRKSPGWTSNSWWVGEPWNTSPAPGPANEPSQRPTTGQTSRSPGGGTRKKKARDVASRVATLLAPLKQQRVGVLHIANLPN